MNPINELDLATNMGNTTGVESLVAACWRTVASHATKLLTPDAWRAISRDPSLSQFCRYTMARADQIRLMQEVRVWYPVAAITPPTPTLAASTTTPTNPPTATSTTSTPSDAPSGVEQMEETEAPPKVTSNRQLYYTHQFNAAGQQHGESREYWPNGTICCVLNYAHGLMDGECIWYNSEGAERLKLNYKDGKKHGEQQEWYRSGKQHLHYFCIDGLRHGSYKGWFKTGVLEFDYQYVQGLQHGEQKEYHRTDILYLLNNFDMGKREGAWNTWYETGGKSIISFFKDDMPDGKKEKYNKAGNLMYSEEWQNGKKHGVFKEMGNYNNVVEHKRWEQGVCVQDLLHSTGYRW
eukprot:TRINITY_DN8201_c0_g1_i1.p1 TRINITY_DN8201_c0_g1~~TRINITY_DN8201_c0_g1_i1.p1  ORF type:complete len:350 (-),score=59.33 TRINITY_DN8201_c0_g1_i1:18-1067(-)